MDEITLVEQARAGDRDAFYTLVRQYERSIYWIAFGLLGNEADAEEVSQEAFLHCFEKLHQFRGESKFSTWLTQIALNEARMRLRKRRPALYESLDTPESGGDAGEWSPRELTDWRANPEEEYASEEVRRVVTAAVDSLRPAYRVVLIMRDLEQMGTEEVAQALGLSLSAAKSRLLRARLMLRERLAAHFARGSVSAKAGWWGRLGLFARRGRWK